jgi:hypothetical protein
LICETIADLLGSRRGESTILDLGSHCGIMALDIAFRGARRVDGFDLRLKNIEQANFLKRYYNIPNVHFEQADVCGMQSAGKWDVVMCLGLLCHVDAPVSLIRLCFDSCNEFAVIDTICHTEPISAYHLIRHRNKDVSIEGKYAHEFHPTCRAVIDTMKEAGFTIIMEVIGECDVPIDLYMNFTRRCFIGFK